MKRLKRFYKNNRIYCILMIISLFCFLLMGSAVILYFIHQASSSNYGNRLDDIDEYPITSELRDLEKYFKEEGKAISASAWVQGKTIKVIVEFEQSVTIETIQNITVGSLDKLMDDQKAYYDISFSFKREGYPPYLGSKKSSNTVISWANYDLSNVEISTTTTKTTTTTKKKK